MAVASTGPSKTEIVIYAISSSVFIIVAAYLFARYLSKKINAKKLKEQREKEILERKESRIKKKRASFSVQFDVNQDVSEDKPYRSSKPKRIRKQKGSKVRQDPEIQDQDTNEAKENEEGAFKILGMVKNTSFNSVDTDDDTETSVENTSESGDGSQDLTDEQVQHSSSGSNSTVQLSNEQ